MTDVGAEATRQRAQALEAIVSDVVEGRLPLSDFAKRLQDAGASPAEGEDYLQQLTQRLEQQKKDREADEQPDTQSGEQAARESTPEGLDEAQVVEFRARRDALLEEVRAREAADRRTAVDTAAWAVLNAKLSRLASSQVPSDSTTLLSADDLAKLLGVERSTPQSLPATVLTLAPHLAELSTSAISDPHIEETWKLRQAIGTDKTIDSLVNLMQDHFVDFEKLFASMDKGYDHNDEPRDFGGGYALVKKDQASAKRPLRSESEWLRVFGAWSSAVVLVYRHRSSELQSYQRMVTDLFRAVPHDPSIAIAFDVEARDRYAKSPFRMDDRTQLNVPLLARMFQSTGPSSKKRSNTSPSTSSPSKRSTIPCRNWNMGICDAPCPNGRRHGICSECEGPHRAKDEPVCNTLLQARQRKGASGGYSESSKGKGRA
ncbi:uncharacterized protein LACBIDRAFT_315653 [Laccaria bicolor S238N-H82]|uniref:Predicted protein n=1 Tax=Laccaria bicolor (strain S238N-H82 / ATCC MYA-4686) TaxID=486041 RepID=B0D2U9_LACBS|nr:uncharacterized protein LACBIDRAFT_315653 [Laccaria bicolor S238N-H82]EDR10816.1 predicted protein [Laccaria bicolor S238N-H82]|eukprot:XP_001878117.1 predicted protein [Laccaria bicolor S238N-H82]